MSTIISEKFDNAIKAWVAPDGIEGVTITILDEMNRVDTETNDTISSFALVYHNHNNGEYQSVEALRLWKGKDGNVQMSCEFQKEVYSRDEADRMRSLFSSLKRFIKEW